ncbi:hypothetical protein [Alteromonas sp. D210916BOD_24]|uniref:hypothetical protein n=1 Tax=Alteromonas sp. D210916BOD_24 TaxID=3157618 RepID=UPI00399CAFC8
MAKPRVKAPTTTVHVFCAKCKHQLFKYRKGGKGALVKCFKARIAQDFTHQEGECPNCHSHFARASMIRGVPALKMIGGKVTMR